MHAGSPHQALRAFPAEQSATRWVVLQRRTKPFSGAGQRELIDMERVASADSHTVTIGKTGGVFKVRNPGRQQNVRVIREAGES